MTVAMSSHMPVVLALVAIELAVAALLLRQGWRLLVRRPAVLAPLGLTAATSLMFRAMAPAARAGGTTTTAVTAIVMVAAGIVVNAIVAACLTAGVLDVVAGRDGAPARTWPDAQRW